MKLCRFYADSIDQLLLQVLGNASQPRWASAKMVSPRGGVQKPPMPSLVEGEGYCALRFTEVAALRGFSADAQNDKSGFFGGFRGLPTHVGALLLRLCAFHDAVRLSLHGRSISGLPDTIADGAHWLFLKDERRLLRCENGLFARKVDN